MYYIFRWGLWVLSAKFWKTWPSFTWPVAGAVTGCFWICCILQKSYHELSAQVDGWTGVRRYWNVERIRKFDHSKSDGEGEGTAESGLSVGFGRISRNDKRKIPEHLGETQKVKTEMVIVDLSGQLPVDCELVRQKTVAWYAKCFH